MVPMSEPSIPDRGRRVLLDTYRRQPLTLSDGRGCVVAGHDGVEYLDCLSGLAVSALGHGHPGVISAIARASGKPLHFSNLYWSEPMVQLAERLVAATGMDRVFFCNSGAEAVEAAIKLSRRARPGRSKVVVFDSSFHGRTMGALSATAQSGYQRPFAPLLPGFINLPFGEPLPAGAIDETTALVLVEPIQGEGGVRPAPRGWLADLARATREAGALLALDEIQSGVGRTGTFLASQHEGVQPDVVCLAKGLAAGLPIGALLVRGPAAASFQPGDHGSTFGGGPFVATVALAVLESVLADGFLATVTRRGAQLRTKLEGIARSNPLVAEVRGRGLMQGLVLHRPVAPQVVAAALHQRLLLAPAGPEVVRMLPPLIITDLEISMAAERLAAALDQVADYYPSGSPAAGAPPYQEGFHATMAPQEVDIARSGGGVAGT